jgi:two-component system cell cycle response regulator
MAKILIIDDDPVYSDMTQQRLERVGHTVQIQVGPFGATAAMSDDKLDLIILDVFMPALSGPDLLDILHKNYPGAKTRVLLCSSMDPAPLACIAAERGADGSVSKAAGRFEFLDAVDAALRLERKA